MRITLLRDRLAHVIGEVIVVPDADVLVDAARGAARTAWPHALDEGKSSRVHECREVVGRLFLLHDAGVPGQLRAQHAVVDDPNSGQGGGGGWHVISASAGIPPSEALRAVVALSRLFSPNIAHLPRLPARRDSLSVASSPTTSTPPLTLLLFVCSTSTRNVRLGRRGGLA